MPEDEAQQPLLNGQGQQPSSASPDTGEIVIGDEQDGPDEQADDGGDTKPEHFSERANWLRAAILGANDGLVSVGAILLGVGAGNVDLHTIVLSGLSALVAGALSMGAGEYISVSAQADTEEADVETERRELASGPAARKRELNELVRIYEERGLDHELARQVAVALSKKDAVRAHARDELGIEVDEYTNPWQAAASSMVCFTAGGAVPLLAGAFIQDAKIRLVSVGIASTVALILFGAVGAYLGGAHKLRASLRVLLGGWLAFAVTFLVGRLFGASPA